MAAVLLSWIAYPAALAVLCVGCGLLVDRATRRTLPRALLLPAGFAALIVLATLLTVLAATAQLAAPALAVAAVAGFVAGLRGGRATRWRPTIAWTAPAAAMAIAFAALAAPVVLTGAPGSRATDGSSTPRRRSISRGSSSTTGARWRASAPTPPTTSSPTSC